MGVATTAALALLLVGLAFPISIGDIVKGDYGICNTLGYYINFQDGWIKTDKVNKIIQETQTFEQASRLARGLV